MVEYKLWKLGLKKKIEKLLRVAHIFFIFTDFIVCISRNNLMSVLIIYFFKLLRIYNKKIKYALYISFNF